MTQTSKLLRRNIRLFYLVTALEYAFFNDAVYILFGHDYLHLNYFRAGSLFFAGWFISIFFDFWGGVIADKIGRKQCTFVGIGLQLVSYIPYLLTKSYPLLVASSIVWGIGVALSSNALHALIYEQVSTQDNASEKTYAHISATSQIWLFISVGIATVCGGFAYVIDPRLPYGLIIIALSIAMILSCFIYVPAKTEQNVAEEASKTNVVRLALSTFRNNKPLSNFLMIGFLAGIFGDLLFAYYQPYYINLKVSAVTLGILFGSLRAASAFGSYLIRRFSSSVTPATFQIIHLGGIILTAFLLLVLKLPLVLAAPVFLGIASGFVDPNMRLYVNKHATNEVRASVLSFSTTTMSFGIGIGFVLAYYFADRVSARTVLELVVIGAIVAIALRLFYSKKTQLYSTDQQ